MYYKTVILKIQQQQDKKKENRIECQSSITVPLNLNTLFRRKIYNIQTQLLW